MFISLQLSPYVLFLALSKNTDWCWVSEWECPYIHPRSVCTTVRGRKSKRAPRTFLQALLPIKNTKCPAAAPRKELLPRHPSGFSENLAKFCAHSICVRRKSKFLSMSQEAFMAVRVRSIFRAHLHPLLWGCSLITVVQGSSWELESWFWMVSNFKAPRQRNCGCKHPCSQDPGLQSFNLSNYEGVCGPRPWGHRERQVPNGLTGASLLIMVM